MRYAIDFGTTNSLLAAADEGRLFDPIPLDPEAKDPTVLRSLLYFPSMSRCFYGAAAIRQYLEHPGEGRLIRSIKKHLPIKSFVGTWIDDRPANLEDLIAFFLGEMRRRANEHFGQDVTRAVIGRPARFAPDEADDRFAQFRLEQAARKAGFTEIDFCPEPIAAACEFRSQLNEPKTVLVGDFGGGTSDFTVMRMSRGPFRDSDVLSMGGVALAGDALDGTLMRHRLSHHFGSDVTYSVPFGTNVLKMPGHLMEKICSPADISVLGKRDIIEFLRNVQKWVLSPADREKMDRFFCLVEEQLGFPLFEEIEKTKRLLSEAESVRFNYEHPRIRITEEIPRREFEGYSRGAVSAILGSLDGTLREAGLKPEQVDVVCCTGGTARVPAIHQGLVQRFGAGKIQEHNRFHSVVKGLAVRAAELG
jgi:hypothetical chaperone protein